MGQELTASGSHRWLLHLSAVDLLGVTCSAVSAASSLLAVVVLQRCSTAAERAKPRNVLVAHCIIADLLASVCDLLNLWSGAIGCLVPGQGGSAFYLASASLTAVTMVFAATLVRRRARWNVSAGRLRAYVLCAYVFSVAFTGLPLLLARRRIVGSEGHWCFLQDWALRTHWPYTSFYGPLWACVAVILAAYAIVAGELSRAGARSPDNSSLRRFSGEGSSVVRALSYYGASLVACWLVPTGRRVAQLVAPRARHPIAVVFLHTATYRLQGLANALIFFATRRALAATSRDVRSPRTKFRTKARLLIAARRLMPAPSKSFFAGARPPPPEAAPGLELRDSEAAAPQTRGAVRMPTKMPRHGQGRFSGAMTSALRA